MATGVEAESGMIVFGGIVHVSKPIFGIQFFPESGDYKGTPDILSNFAFKVCKARAMWKKGGSMDEEVRRIRKLIGSTAQVIGGISGGLGSTAAALLMKQAIGDRFHPILVDTVLELFYMEAVRIEREAKNTAVAGKVKWLVQGTIFPDLFESLGLGRTSNIIEHKLAEQKQNGEPQCELLEPFKLLSREQIRALVRQADLPEDLFMRHPFPLPGLSIRIIGMLTPNRVKMVRKADDIFISMIKEAGIYNQVSQAYAALDTSVAARSQGLTREDEQICILRAVVCLDLMHAEPYHFPWMLLSAISSRIVDEVDGITRVVYDITSKPPGAIELE
ncbi:hypothetical protein N3K66_003922 [Trichothecium roseum]|uniref:Uncharacterized protein n=1 Tax=Trichothecium roseum TaxID=47278 RepID=A0ACC0V885_9HYPO|nr:hypothetical protein N3K66_003922 [Trichothecium roseum]